MNELAARKRLIVAQADLHRQLLALERRHLQERWAPVRRFAGRNRWWLLAGAVAGGLVLARGWRGWIGRLPAVLAAWRALQR